MRVITCMLTLGLLFATVSGCSLFKKNNTGGAAPANNGAVPPPVFPGAGDPLKASPPTFPTGANTQTYPTTIPASASNTTTILAGTITDENHNPIGNAFIRPINLEEKENGAPIDVVADGSGHFIIQGVKPGASYKLIARTKRGDKMLAGVFLTKAPNVRVMISIREDFADANTPPLPAAPAYQAPPAQTPPAHTPPNQTSQPNQTSKNTDPFGTAWNFATKPAQKSPLGFEGVKQAGEPNLPAMMNVPAPPPTYPPGFADNQNSLPPMLSMPGNRPRPNLPPGPGDSKLDTGPARVPSCVIVANRLENMALKDSKGQIWEYRKQGYGKLMLIDFWGTYCIHCKEVMPTLNRLQSQYGARGLEVIGIAVEAGKDERKEAEAVNRFCNAMQVRYRQLMGRSGAFDVSKHFRIDGVPTLMLVNENGDIFWHHFGKPNAATLNALERTIQNRLNNRPF